DTERVERTEAMPEFEQVRIVDREERSLEGREDRQLVVGPFDGGHRRADGLDLFAAMKRLAADQQMRDATSLDGVDIPARDVFAEADEPPEQHRDVLRSDRHVRLGTASAPL